jgi:hypothetical protein
MTAPSRRGLRYGWPTATTPFLNPDGTLSRVWYRLLAQLWAAVGGDAVATTEQLYVAQKDATVQVFSPITNQPVGTLSLVTGAGSAPVPQVLVASPWVFSAPQVGVLVCAGGKLEIGRNGSWFPAGLTGGSPMLMTGDQARVTWFSGEPPVVTWLPA